MRRRAYIDGPDPIDVFVGSRVRARRVGLRLSQTKLGDALGITFQQIQKYENGANRIGASNLFKIAKTLGVEVSYFFQDMPSDVTETAGGDKETGNGPGLSDRPAALFEHDPMNSREAINLMHNFFRIKNEKIRRRLFNFVKTLADSGDGE